MLAGLLTLLLAVPAAADSHDDMNIREAPSPTDEPDEFTSAFSVPVDPDTVPDGGEQGATGTFDLRLNSDAEVVCYDIELEGVTPPYESPALTATHIHEGDPGEVGPPRVVFDDPEPQDDGTLRSSGCVEGPFTTGAEDDDGVDEGEGFSLTQIEDDPGAFYVDTHTEDFEAGAARGQFGEPMPVDGVETGAGGTTDGGGSASLLGIGALLVTGGGLAFALRRRGVAAS